MKKREKKKSVSWGVLLFCLLIVCVIAFLGNLFTADAVESSWYDSIKISLVPPNWVFPVAWTILFVLIAFSMYFAWVNAGEKDKTKVTAVFGINLILNVVWSFLFFWLRSPKPAFFELLALWISIIPIIYVTWKIKRISSWLVIPYWFWISFAGILNYLIAF